MRALLILIMALGLGACQLIYKLPTRQGNVLEQKQLDQLQVGMTRDQVTFLIGTPVASNPFSADRWDYLGYYRSPRGQVSDRLVTLYFDKDKLSRMDGINEFVTDKGAGTPDPTTTREEKKKDKFDEERNKDNPKTHEIMMRPPQVNPESTHEPEPDPIPIP